MILVSYGLFELTEGSKLWHGHPPSHIRFFQCPKRLRMVLELHLAILCLLGLHEAVDSAAIPPHLPTYELHTGLLCSPMHRRRLGHMGGIQRDVHLCPCGKVLDRVIVGH